MDLRNAFVTVSYRSDGTPESFKAYVENIQTQLIKLTDLLGDQKFFAGDEVCVGKAKQAALLLIGGVVSSCDVDQSSTLRET